MLYLHSGQQNLHFVDLNITPSGSGADATTAPGTAQREQGQHPAPEAVVVQLPVLDFLLHQQPDLPVDHPVGLPKLLDAAADNISVTSVEIRK